MNSEKINILIVDDLPEKRLVLGSILEELGQNVISANSGPEALRHLMDHDFAVILLDVNMPDMDGYETAAMIRRRKKSTHTPIIFITAYADEFHTVHGYTLGAVDFILSPVVPEILRTKVKVFVDLFRMNQQVKRQAQEQVDLAQAQAAQRAAEERVREVQEADRRKNEFLSVLAHELRNPLAPLMNGIDVLRLLGSKQPDVQKIHDMMDRQVHHLVRLVDDLLDISRITRDKIQLQREPVEVSLVVERAVEVSKPLLDAQEHRFTITLPPKPIFVNADPVRLGQVLSNLLNNAAKYTEKGGVVSLGVALQENDVVFRVRDNGMGIPAEMLTSIFDPFTQVKHSQDRSQGGLGIGLTLVRRLVEMHGGQVKASSAGADQGSEFEVRLPAYTCVAAPAPVPCAEPPAKTNGRQRVLVVDDNSDVAEGTAMLLEQIGSEVHVVHDGPAALTAAVAFQPEVVLLDIGLPGMDGYEVARRLRVQWGSRGPLLVAVSGYGQAEDRERSAQAGFDVHLVKPASLADLRALLANSLPAG